MRASLALLILLLPGCIAAQVQERAFRPRAQLRLTPEDLGLAPETLVLPVDGALLHAWRFRGGGAGDTLVVLGGNADNKELFLPLARELTAAAYDVVLVDWRGFGLSTGEPSLGRLVPDAEAVVERVRADPSTRSLAVLGVSLGSPVALAVAARRTGDVDAVLVESLVVPRHALAEEVGGVAAFLFGWAVIPSGFDVHEHARELPQPILFVHGADDGLTELAPAAEVYAAAMKASAPRACWIVEGAGHSPGIAGAHGPGYVARMRRFLNVHLRGEPDRARVVVEQQGERASVRLGPEADARTPVELAFVPEEAPPRFERVFLEPGRAADVTCEDDDELIAAFADVPAWPVRELPGGGWEPDAPYHDAQRACLELEGWALDRLGHGLVLRIGGQSFTFQLVDEERPPGWMAEACADVRARLEASERPDLPASVQLTRSELWLALAGRYLEEKDEARGREALERALALLPPEPFGTVRFGDSSWQLGFQVDPLAGAFEELAALAQDPAVAEADRARAAEWRARAAARAALLGEWNARQRAERDRLAGSPAHVGDSAP